MARNETSRIKFDIDITGAKAADLQRLSNIVGNLIDKFEKLEDVQGRIGGEGTGVSGGGTQGRSGNLSKGYAESRMSEIELGVRQGEISSIKQLQGNYGQLIRTLNRLEKQGEQVGQLRLRAHKMNQRVTNSIQEKNRALRRNNKAKMKNASSTDRMRSSMISNMQGLSFSQKTLSRSTQALRSNMQSTKRASYTLLNIGYLIQDSPYGIRGMANNVSQLTQSWSMMAQRIQTVNAKTGQNLTVTGQLWKMMKGPTGMIMLIGSVLPAAMEYLSQNWDSLTSSQEANTVETKEQLSIMKDLVKTGNELRQTFGDDPLDIRSLRSQVSDLKQFKDQIKSANKATDAWQASLTVSAVREGGIIGYFKHIFGYEAAEPDLLKQMKEFRKESGKFDNIDYSGFIEEVEKLQAKLDFKEWAIEQDPMLKLKSKMSKRISSLEKQLKRAKQVSDEAAVEQIRRKIKRMEKNAVQSLKAARESGDQALAGVQSYIIEETRGLLEGEDEEGDERGDFNGFKLLTGFESLDDMTSSFGDQVSSLTEAKLARQEMVGDRELDNARTIQAKKQALEERHQSKMAQIEMDRVLGEFDNSQEYLNARWEQKKAFQDKMDSLSQSSAMHDIKMQQMQLEQGMDNPSYLEEQKKRIKEYYDLKRTEARKAADTEMEANREVAQINQSERERMKKTDQTYNQAKRQVYKQGAQSTITSIQAVSQFANASAKKQFQIQKVASASQAIVNGYLAYTKTMAQGGFLATPLAITAMVSSFAKAAKIMSQSYDSARATGAGGPAGGGSVGYRGLNFQSSQQRMINRRTGSAQQRRGTTTPSVGTSTGINEKSSSSGKKKREKVPMEILDGYGNIVAKGNINLDNQNRSDLGYWK